jgi:glucose/arabinose dehydrogenase
MRRSLIALALALTACSPGGTAATSPTSPETTAIGTATATSVAATTTSPAPDPSTAPTTTTTTTVPPPPLSTVALTVEKVADGLGQPVFVTSRPGDDRLFVVDQVGTVRAATPGREVVLDLTDRVRYGGERGLLGLAFHPTDSTRMFVDYIDLATGDTVVAEYRLPLDAVAADPDSVRTVLQVPQPAPNHNGGMIAFGPDGYLYVSLGDGGGGGDQYGNGQNVDTLLGAILRIDVSADPYLIPSDNPFASGGGADEIWAYGLRNPWRFSFDGDTVWVGDVGQGRIEEVDVLHVAIPGGNLGWPILEGPECYRTAGCDSAGLVAPVHWYEHAGGRCSITGGYVYRGTQIPDLVGTYVFGDYCTGEIMGLRLRAGEVVDTVVFGTLGGNLTSFGVDEAQNLYVTGGDGVWRIVPAS